MLLLLPGHVSGEACSCFEAALLLYFTAQHEHHTVMVSAYTLPLLSSNERVSIVCFFVSCL